MFGNDVLELEDELLLDLVDGIVNEKELEEDELLLELVDGIVKEKEFEEDELLLELVDGIVKEIELEEDELVGPGPGPGVPGPGRFTGQIHCVTAPISTHILLQQETLSRTHFPAGIQRKDPSLSKKQ